MKILLVVYDNGSYISEFPIGLAYIAAVLSEKGHDVSIYNQDMHHYPDSHLTEYLDKNKFDVVGISVVGGYYQYRKLLKLSEAINRSKNRPFYVIGGHGPAPEPEYFLKKTGADVVVIGEGEDTVIELMDAVSGDKRLEDIKGIAFRRGPKTVLNKRRPLIKDIDTIPFPAYELFPMEYYRLMRIPHAANSDFAMPILSGRGCLFKCTFCYRMDEGLRPRKNSFIIEEIELLKSRYRVNCIAFYDELLMSSPERVESLCKDFIKAKLHVKWICNGRLNFASADSLKLMKKAGCVFINYGIEAMDDDVLRNMRKALTVKQVIKGIEATLRAGISPGLNIIFGNIGDNKNTIRKDVEFLMKYDDGAQLRTIRPVTPYPGSPLYYYAIEKGLIKDIEDFYENKHTNSDLLTANLTDMTDNDFYNCLMEANIKLVDNYFENKKKNIVKQTKELYTKRDSSFRGFRQT